LKVPSLGTLVRVWEFTSQYFFVVSARIRSQEWVREWARRELTFDLERTPPVESIQMYLMINELQFFKKRLYGAYSAIAFPFWSRARYFNSCNRVSTVGGDGSELGSKLTLAV